MIAFFSIPTSRTAAQNRLRDQFDSIARREVGVLYRVAKRLVRSDALAEDLVSNTLINAFRAFDRFDGLHVRSWLLRILRNEFHAHIRKASTRNEVQIEDFDEPTDDGYWESVDWSLVGPQIVEQLDKLPEEYKLAVVLCDIEGMSYDEAARVLDVPLGTVRSRLFRGRKLLQAKLVRFQSEVN